MENGQFLKPLKLGGSLKIKGEQFSVALFQGEKFRDDTWALINLNKIGMRYDTQVEQLIKVSHCHYRAIYNVCCVRAAHRPKYCKDQGYGINSSQF